MELGITWHYTEKNLILSFRLAYQAPSSIAKSQIIWSQTNCQLPVMVGKLDINQSGFIRRLRFSVVPILSSDPVVASDFRGLSNLMTKYASVCPRCTLLRSGVIFRQLPNIFANELVNISDLHMSHGGQSLLHTKLVIGHGRPNKSKICKST